MGVSRRIRLPLALLAIKYAELLYWMTSYVHYLPRGLLKRNNALNTRFDILDAFITHHYNLRSFFFNRTSPPTQMKEEENIENFSQFYDERMLEFKKTRNYSGIIQLFEERRTRKLPIKNLKMNNLVMYSYGKQKDLIGMLIHLQDMANRSVKLDVMAYNTIIQAFTQSGDTERPLEYLQEMKRLGIKPDGFSYSWVLSSLASNEIKLLEVFDEMKSHGFLELEDFNFVMNTFAKRGDVTQMNLIFEEMNQRGLTPNRKSFSILLNGYAEQGDTERILEIFNDMKKSHLNTPDISSYNILLKCFSKKQDFVKLIQIFNEMNSFFSSSISPDLLSYSTVINAYGECGDIDKMMSFFHQMKRSRIKPDKILYNILVSAFARKGDRNMIIELMTEMQSLGFQMDEWTFTSVMDGILNSFSHELTSNDDFIEEMKRPGSPFDSNNFSTDSKHDLQTIISAFTSSSSSPPPPPSSSFGLERTIDFVLNQMRSRRIDPNVATYGVILKHHAKTSNAEDMRGDLEKMRVNFIQPSPYIYSILMDNFLKTETLPMALKKITKSMEDMKTRGISPNHVNYNLLIAAFGRTGNISKVRIMMRIAS